MSLVIYKLGGSLLTLADLDRRLTSLLEAQLPLSPASSASRPFDRALLVGGGSAADLVRDWDKRHKLGAERAHDLALGAMTLNARFINSLLTNSEFVSRSSSIRPACARGSIVVLDPVATLAEAERRAGERLPRSWNVTSDSIAAFLAIQFRAAALVLMTSTPRPAGRRPAAAARQGLVDKHFPRVANRIPIVAWANLRSKRPAIERWL